MKRIFTLFCAVIICQVFYAQKELQKGLNSINKEVAEAHLSVLTDDLLEGREAGFKGSQLAALYIASQLKQWEIAPFFKTSYFQPFSAYRKERQKKGRYQVHPDSIKKLQNVVHQKLSMKNILCTIPGKIKDEYVVVGAHYDHLGVDPALDGDQIYNGADDNGSGVTVVLQIAKAFIESGIQPKRTLIFAFWDGEEKGLLGSKYFIQTSPILSQIKAYVNFDMVGRECDPNNVKKFVHFYTAAHPLFGKWMKKCIDDYQLTHITAFNRPWDNPVGGSDNTMFAYHKIPIMWCHTDGHKDYHLPSDEIDKICWDKLIDITKAYFLCTWKLANEKKY